MNQVHSRTTISPLVNRVLVALETRLQQGVYLPGQALPAERNLAEEFGVSRMVVRSALDSLCDLGLIDRKLGCRPRACRIQSPRKRVKRKTIALWLTHGPSEAEIPALLSGIQKRLNQDHYRLLVENATGETPEAVIQSEARFLIRLAQDRDIAGALLWYVGGRSNVPALNMLRESGVPVVFIDRFPPEGIEADHVGVSNSFSSEQAVRHLIELGHRRILMVSNLDAASTVQERFSGYKAALEASGIEFDDELVFCANARTADLASVCQSIVEAALRLHRPPTAAFCVNDRIAFHVIDALKARGVAISKDFAVVGFDGIERWLPHSPFLTTCCQPFERIGATAVDLLLRRIDSDEPTAYRHVLLEAPLTIYGSTSDRQTEPSHFSLSQ